MQLFVNNSSPYSRVARIVALEKGLAAQVELVQTDPWAGEDILAASNPANRVPALATDEGVSITESLLIAHYLDTLSDQQPLLPARHLIHALHLCGLGQGLMEAAFTTVITEKFQGTEAVDSFFGRRRSNAIRRTLTMLNDESSKGYPDVFTLGEIVVGVALEYLDFRLPSISWRDRCPALRKFFQKISGRDSFRLTSFK